MNDVMADNKDTDENSGSTGIYPQVSWDEQALPGELCCKELVDRRHHDENELMPTCGRPATKAIVSETGERIPFCNYHWARG